MEDLVYYNNLYDIYHELLTEKEQENFCDYYQEDLSLAEIADNKKVSRTAVAKTIKTVLEKLDYYEKILNIYNKESKLKSLLDCDNIDEIKKQIEKILGN